MTGPYKSGFCTTGAAAWSHAKCSHTYGHPPYEATCACTCHDPVDAQVDAAFEFAKATTHGIIDARRVRDAGWYRRAEVNLVADLHAIYGDLWDVPLDKPIEVAG